MKSYLVSITAAALLFFVISCNSSVKNNSSTDTADSNTDFSASSQNSDKNAEFSAEAASAGLMEVELGQLAQQNGSSQRVKDFGALMVKDHGKANEELKQLAAAKNIQLPSAPLEKHQKHIDKLKDKKGVDFDKDYIKMMVDDHEEDIKKFQDAANDVSDTDLKAFAAKTLPVLQTHLDSAKAISKSIKGSVDPGVVTEGMQRQTHP